MIRKIDSNIFSLTILKVTTFSRIRQHNRQFEQISPIKQCFLQVFEPANTPEEGEYLMAAAIFDILKQKFGSSLQVSSIQKLGRELQNIEGLKNRRTRFGTEYLVVRK